MTKGAARWQSLPACQVERMCRYVTDDGTVAAYFRIPREDVVKIRSRMRKDAPEPSYKTAKNGDPISGGDTEIRRKAEDGSIRLLNMLERLFERFAHRHGLTAEKAKELQLNGYRA